MQPNPLITVICLCYNHAEYVIESLQSVINQTYKSIELIVVDDCSSDNSVSIIRKWLLDYPNINLIVNEKNLGNTKTFNLAAQFAKGDYLIDLAADDILLENCVALQFEKFQNSIYKNLAVVYGNCELIDERGSFLNFYFDVDASNKTIEMRKTGDVYVSVLKTGKSICSVSSMMRKSVFDLLQGYDENLAYEDLDYWIRASRLYDFDYIDAVLVQKRIVKTSMTASFFKPNSEINKSTYLILKKALALNKSLEEDLMLQKRVHYEIILSYNNRNFDLLCKNIWIRIQIEFRKWFKKYSK